MKNDPNIPPLGSYQRYLYDLDEEIINSMIKVEPERKRFQRSYVAPKKPTVLRIKPEL